MKYFIVSSNKHLDLLGSKIANQIASLDVRAEFLDFEGRIVPDEAQAGDYCSSLNGPSIWPIRSFGIVKKVKRKVFEANPDVLILVGFDKRFVNVSRSARQAKIKTCLIAGSSMKTKVDGENLNLLDHSSIKFLATTPVDFDFLMSKRMNADYIGNPAVELIKEHKFEDDFSLNENEVNIAVIPGSGRKQARRAKSFIYRMIQEKQNYNWQIAVTSDSKEVFISFESLGNVCVTEVPKYDLFRNCNAAMVVSPNDSLESASLNCPQVYVHLNGGRVKQASLVNQVAKKEVIKEFSGKNCKPATVLAELDLILNDQNYCAGILADYQMVKSKIGNDRASRKAAQIIVDWLEESGSS
ncbi:MAG: hypothetical protein ABJP45_11885 [Cyclobacteriaceae bacterium]